MKTKNYVSQLFLQSITVSFEEVLTVGAEEMARLLRALATPPRGPECVCKHPVEQFTNPCDTSSRTHRGTHTLAHPQQ